jgi:hypothetical protein
MAATYTLITSSTVGAGGAASVTFSSIPQTYTDLLLVVSSRCDVAATQAALWIYFNNDNAGSRSDRELQGDGSSVTSGVDSGPIKIGRSNGATSTANTFSNIEVYIPNYTSSNYKSYSSNSVQENNATTGYQTMLAGLYNASTTAISRIDLYNNSSANFVQYSTFYLYGIKNS